MFLLLIVAVIATVDTGNFRSCSESRFCSENINQSPGPWKLISPKYESGIFESKLISENYNTELLLKLSSYQTGGFRVRIEPVTSQDFRYDLSGNANVMNQDVLSNLAPLQMTKTSTSWKFELDNIEVEVELSPLVITFSENGKEMLKLNAEQQFIFEMGCDGELKSSHRGFIDTAVHGKTAVGADILFIGEDVKLTGLPERANSINLADTEDTPLRLFNSDAFEYEADNPIHLYGSIPYIVAHSPSYSASILWANPSDTFVHIETQENGRKCHFVSEGGFIDISVFIGDFRKITKEYCQLTGFPVMPPLFALGYHQSRWGYSSQHEVGIVMRGLDDVHIPFDSLWLDIDHLIQKSPFTFSKNAFPDPQRLMATLRDNDRYMVKVCDPHFPHNSEHRQYKDVRSKKYAVNMASGTPFVGDVWPGQSVFPDFMNPAVVNWWGSQMMYGVDETSENVFYWNDMNEPSIFKSDESTFPKSLVHFGGYENREVHNIYGLMNTVGSYHGLIKRNPDHNTRPFIMTRSFFAGSQKFAWTWTGDNTASWEHMQVSIPMVLTLGVCGMPFTGADVGGFLKSPDGALLARWYETGAWTYPFFREHCHHKTSRREPFMFDGEELQAMKNAVVSRYKMLPVWYTASKVCNETGVSPVTPLWVEFPEEETFHEIDSQIILGQSLLVCPVLEDDVDDIEIVKPPGIWYKYPSGDILTDTTVAVDLIETPVYLRGGKIIATFARAGKSALDTLSGPLILYVALDENGEAEGEVYLDDGVSYNFVNGEYIRKTFRFSNSKLTSTGTVLRVPENLVNTVIEKAVIFSTDGVKTIDINKKVYEDF